MMLTSRFCLFLLLAVFSQEYVISVVKAEGYWAEWADSGSCSEACGTGLQLRTRECLWGEDCPGEATQSISCIIEPCRGPLSESVVKYPCGKHLSGLESGEFVSPGYPDVTKYPYQSAVVCDIIIEVPKGKVVDLQFIDFDLPGGRMGDYVSVYDGPNDSHSSLSTDSHREKWANDWTPTLKLSSSNMVMVRFNSEKDKFSGWQLEKYLAGEPGWGYRGFRALYISRDPPEETWKYMEYVYVGLAFAVFFVLVSITVYLLRRCKKSNLHASQRTGDPQQHIPLQQQAPPPYPQT